MFQSSFSADKEKGEVVIMKTAETDSHFLSAKLTEQSLLPAQPGLVQPQGKRKLQWENTHLSCKKEAFLSLL